MKKFLHFNNDVKKYRCEFFKRTRPKLYFRSISYVTYLLALYYFHINFLRIFFFIVKNFICNWVDQCRTQSKTGTPVRHLTYCTVRVCFCCFPELNSLLKSHTRKFFNFLKRSCFFNFMKIIFLNIHDDVEKLRVNLSCFLLDIRGKELRFTLTFWLVSGFAYFFTRERRLQINFTRQNLSEDFSIRLVM